MEVSSKSFSKSHTDTVEVPDHSTGGEVTEQCNKAEAHASEEGGMLWSITNKPITFIKLCDG